jgi:methionine-rich copper-binding protein CopC
MEKPMSSHRHRPLAAWASLLAVLALVLTVAPAHAERNGGSAASGDHADAVPPALKFTSLGVGPTPAYGGSMSLRFTTNYSSQATTAKVYYTPDPGSPLTDLLATTDHEGTISWPSSPRFKPGEYQVRLEVGKEEGETIQSSRLTVTVGKAEVTSVAADDDLRVAQYRPVELSLNLQSTATDAVPGGAYTLLAKPVAGGPDVVIQEGGFDGAGPHVFQLQQFAATHPGEWELYFLTSETPLIAFSSAWVAHLEVLPSRVPTSLTLQPGSSSHEYGDRSAGIEAILAADAEVTGLTGRVRLLDEGKPTGAEVEVTGPGLVRIALSDLGVGTHRLSLEYLGNDVHEGSATIVRPVTVTKPGTKDPDQQGPGKQTPGTLVAAQVDGKVTLKKARKALVVKVAVTAPGLTVPLSGQVQVLDGKKVLRTVDITATGGLVKLALKLKRLKRTASGKHRITVRYLGAASVLPAAHVWKVKLPRR